jgi:hypothetical protein
MGIDVRLPAFAKTAAFIQLTALMLLQIYSVAPVFSRNLISYARVMRCTGDHAKCGCSPERIAAHTCCCYQSKRLGFFTPPAGGSIAGAQEETSAAHMDADHCDFEKPVKLSCCTKGANRNARFAQDDHGRPLPCICSVPCGGDPAFTSVSLEKLKFLRPSILPVAPVEIMTAYLPSSNTVYQGRFPEPPTPPPRNPTFS